MTSQAQKIAILGSGVWGSALRNLFLHNSHDVRVWSRKSTNSLEEVITDVEIIVSAVSIEGLYPTLERLHRFNISPKILFVSATKGLDPVTTKTPSQIWQQSFPNHSIVVLSGPNLSKEIQQGLPATTVVSSSDPEAAQTIQKALSCDLFRVYINADPLGTELGGTLKNVMAIAAGVCDGLELGTNAKAALLTRALPEMIRVGTYLGAMADTFFGLSGLGDLLATCNSPLSRNYQVGYQLAKGVSLEDILTHLEGTAEGINTTKVLMKIAENQQIYMPITHQVHSLIEGKITPVQAVRMLMERNLKAEY